MRASAYGLHTKEVELRFNAKPYSVSVLSGTDACKTMTPVERTVDLLVLLGKGLTEERLVKLLRRWALPAMARDAGGAAAADDSEMAGDDDEAPPPIFD